MKIFSRWNIPKRRSEAKFGQNQCSGALQGFQNLHFDWLFSVDIIAVKGLIPLQACTADTPTALEGSSGELVVAHSVICILLMRSLG